MKRKKIYIDGLGIVEGHISGVGQYIIGILRGIDDILDNQKNKGMPTPDVRVLIPFDKVGTFKKYRFRHVGYKRFPLPFRFVASFWYRGWLPPIDLWFGRAAYIFPRFVSMPLLFSKSAALTIFDLSYETHREFSDTKNALFLSNMVKKSLRTSKKIITISENAKREIVEFYNVSPDTVRVATPAVDQRYFYKRRQDQIDAVKRKYGITSKHYVLALSNLEPRKNLNALVDAYCALPAKTRKDTSLLLVGVNGWKTEELFQKIITKVEEGYDIVRPSQYVTDADKPAILSGASVLVYPSHYEGFGMPPLEALACGTPVITSDNSSLPEVVKGVGKMVPSTDQEALNNALKEVLTNNALYAERVKRAGPERASKFSWERSAQAYLEHAGVELE